MNTIADETVKLAKKGGPAINKADAEALLKKLSGWSIINDEGMDKLERVYKVDDYLTTLALANKIGRIAEQNNHHPLMIVEWGRVTVQWWTHTIGGLHKNDFILAAKCDRAAMLVGAP